jgi:hypothetical protein
MKHRVIWFLSALFIFTFGTRVFADVAGEPGDELLVAKNGKAIAVVVVAADAGKYEKQPKISRNTSD